VATALVLCWKKGIVARPKNGTEKDHNAHNIITDLRLSEPNGYNIFCGWIVHHLLGYRRLLPLQSTKDLLICEKQSLSVRVYPLRYAVWTVEILLKTWNSNVLDLLSRMEFLCYRRRYSSKNGWVNEYWAIPSTDCSNISFLLHNNLLIRPTQYIVQRFSNNAQCYWQSTVGGSRSALEESISCRWSPEQFHKYAFTNII